MSVLNATMAAIAAMLVVALLALPYIIALKAWNAWHELPREVYTRHRQQVFNLPPIYLWIACAVLAQISRFFEWLHWLVPERIAEAASLAIIATVLIFHLVWAFHIVRSRLDLDARLRRFARYALWSSAMGILLVAVSIAGYLQQVF